VADRTNEPYTVEQRGDGEIPPLPADPVKRQDPAAGGGFELDQTTMHGVLGGLDHETSRIGEDQGGLVDAEWTGRAPAEDIISRAYAAKLQVALLEFVTHNEAMRSYSTTSVDNIKASLAAYLHRDTDISAFVDLI
jgi:hypothetical protein